MPGSGKVFESKMCVQVTEPILLTPILLIVSGVTRRVPDSLSALSEFMRGNDLKTKMDHIIMGYYMLVIVRLNEK